MNRHPLFNVSNAYIFNFYSNSEKEETDDDKANEEFSESDYERIIFDIFEQTL